MGSTDITAESVLGDFTGLDLGCIDVLRFEENGWRGLCGVVIPAASIVTLGRTEVVSLGGTGLVADSSSLSCSTGSSSSTALRTFFFVGRDREVLVDDLEEPALAVVVRAAVRVDFLGGSVKGGLVEGGFFDGGFAWITSPSTTVGRTPGGLPRRLGASGISTSVAGSTSIGTAAAFLVTRFGGAFSVLDGPAVALDRVAPTPAFFFVGPGSSRTSGPGSPFAVARRVVRAVVRGFVGGFAGVTGPSDRSLRREGSDGRGSAGALRFGGIVDG